MCSFIPERHALFWIDDPDIGNTKSLVVAQLFHKYGETVVLGEDFEDRQRRMHEYLFMRASGFDHTQIGNADPIGSHAHTQAGQRKYPRFVSNRQLLD